MSTKRFIKSVTATAAATDVVLPWARQTRAFRFPKNFEMPERETETTTGSAEIIEFRMAA